VSHAATEEPAESGAEPPVRPRRRVVELTSLYSTRHFDSNRLREVHERASSVLRPDARTPDRQIQHRLTDAETVALLAARRAGASIRRLALQFHVCRQTVRRVTCGDSKWSRCSGSAPSAAAALPVCSPVERRPRPVLGPGRVALGINIGTVRSRLHRCRAELRTALAPVTEPATSGLHRGEGSLNRRRFTTAITTCGDPYSPRPLLPCDSTRPAGRPQRLTARTAPTTPQAVHRQDQTDDPGPQHHQALRRQGGRRRHQLHRGNAPSATCR
jgi:hypothetical protein